jgi:signal transduction histidine kinase
MAVVSVGFLAIFVAVVLLAERALGDSRARLREQRMLVAQQAAERVDALLLQAVADLDRVGRDPAFDPDAPREERTAVLADAQRWLSSFSGGLFLVDPDGEAIQSHPPGLTLGVRRFAALGGAVAGEGGPGSGADRAAALLSPPYLDPRSGRPTVAVFAPIRRGDRVTAYLAGLFVLDVPEIVDTLRQAASASDTQHAVLVDAEGRTLASTLAVEFLAPAEHATFYRRTLAGGEVIESDVPVEQSMASLERGELHTMAVAPLFETQWALAVGGPAAEADAGVRDLRRGAAWVAALGLLAAWLITYAGTRRLVRPVQRLTGAAQQIAGGDLATPLQVAEGGEIGAMAAALETMRRQLLDSITALGRMNEDLESRVVERTRALQDQQRLTQHFARRVISAQEEERSRLAHELHDGIGQSLTGIRLGLDRAAKAVGDDPELITRRLDLSRTITDQAMADLRRMIVDLRPGILDQLGLAPALQWVADHTLRANGIEVSMESVGLEERLAPAIETILFRIGQEAMTNIARHSGAEHVTLAIVRRTGSLSLTIEDDGRGFDPARRESGAPAAGGIGLPGMRERAAAAGGRLVVTSAPGGGTRIRAEVPLVDEPVPDGS